MWNELYKSFLDSAQTTSVDFRNGYIAGVLVALVVVLLLMLIRSLLKFIFREKRCRSIVIREKDGDLLISADAIYDVIKSIQPEFRYIHFNKIQLYRRKKAYRVLLHINFNTQGGGMPRQREELKRRIKDLLSEVFGIDSIRKVSMRCGKTDISGTAPVAADAAIKADKAKADKQLEAAAPKVLPEVKFSPDKKQDKPAESKDDTGKGPKDSSKDIKSDPKADAKVEKK